MKTMDLKKSFIFFGVPGISMFLMFTFVYRMFINHHISIHWSTYLCCWGPIIILLGIVLIGFFKSKVRFTDYFLIGKLNKKQIWIVLGLFILVQLLESFLGFTRPILALLPGFHVPEYYPDLFGLDMEFKIPLETFLGMKLSGNYFPIFFWCIWLITNIGCEELLWRGYALPRMETYFGKWAWLVNGLLWNICIHFFIRWSFISLIPVTCIVPYFSQKYGSIWPGVIIHGIGNMFVFALLIPSI